ncbi:hypothetical protein DL93DRAFT_2160613 [Clavulina sp. PMI_390]|nr:hypothetical protein DL93DRAFT_2160613 [Clavulina sp. PMI_390]
MIVEGPLRESREAKDGRLSLEVVEEHKKQVNRMGTISFGCEYCDRMEIEYGVEWTKARVDIVGEDEKQGESGEEFRMRARSWIRSLIDSQDLAHEKSPCLNEEQSTARSLGPATRDKHMASSEKPIRIVPTVTPTLTPASLFKISQQLSQSIYLRIVPVPRNVRIFRERAGRGGSDKKTQNNDYESKKTNAIITSGGGRMRGWRKELDPELFASRDIEKAGWNRGDLVQPLNEPSHLRSPISGNPLCMRLDGDEPERCQKYHIETMYRTIVATKSRVGTTRKTPLPPTLLHGQLFLLEVVNGFLASSCENIDHIERLGDTVEE